MKQFVVGDRFMDLTPEVFLVVDIRPQDNTIVLQSAGGGQHEEDLDNAIECLNNGDFKKVI